MTIKTNSSQRTFWKAIAIILLFFLCSTPLFYVLAVVINVRGIVYIAARIVRLLLVAVIAYAIRKRNQEMIDQDEQRRKRFMIFTLVLVFVSICLHLSEISSDLYWSLCYKIGLLTDEIEPFLGILWEQLFAGDLYWGILLSLFIVFFRKPKKHEAEM